MTPLARVDASAHAAVPAQADRLGDAIRALDSAAAALREMQNETPAG